jgi:hypothetical protein
VVRGTRVGDPLGAEGLRQGSLIPPPPPPRPRRVGRRRWSPVRRIGGSTHDHGCRLVRGTRPPSLTLVGPHGDTPCPRVGDGRPECTSGKPPLARPGGRSTMERGRRRGRGRWWGSDECARRRRGRGGWVVAPGELLQGKGITDLQESGWRLLVREQCPHGLVAAGEAPQNVEDQDVLRDREPCSSSSCSSRSRIGHPARACEARRRAGGRVSEHSRETESRGKATSRARWDPESARCPEDPGRWSQRSRT